MQTETRLMEHITFDLEFVEFDFKNLKFNSEKVDLELTNLYQKDETEQT